LPDILQIRAKVSQPLDVYRTLGRPALFGALNVTYGPWDLPSKQPTNEAQALRFIHSWDLQDAGGELLPLTPEAVTQEGLTFDDLTEIVTAILIDLKRGNHVSR